MKTRLGKHYAIVCTLHCIIRINIQSQFFNILLFLHTLPFSLTPTLSAQSIFGRGNNTRPRNMICFQLMDVFQELANVRKLFTMATKGRPDPSVTPGVHFSFGFSCSLFPWGSFERMNKPNFSNIRPSLFRRCGSLCIFIEIDITRFCRFTQLE